MELGSSKTVFVSFTVVLSNVAGVSGSNSNPAGVMVAGTGAVYYTHLRAHET